MSQYYAIKNPFGELLNHTISETEKNTMDLFGKYVNWDYLKKIGYRCVKVEIRENKR